MPPTRPIEQLEFDLVRFGQDARAQEFTLDLKGETFWATRGEMAELFRTSEVTIARQIDAVFAEGELARAETTQHAEASGERYNLDVILSVGYRVNSARATAFRQWASRTLRALVVDGYAIDEARLRTDGGASAALSAKLRAIRADERSIYESVRAFFATGATDYEADSEACRAFVQSLEDTFVQAVTGQTPPRLMLARADHDRPGMGLHGVEGRLPTMDEARIAQNYLDADELFRMHLLCEQFLLAVQQRALREAPTTMADLNRVLDALLRLDGYPVLPHHKAYHAERAIRHAQAEYARYIMRARSKGAPAGS